MAIFFILIGVASIIYMALYIKGTENTTLEVVGAVTCLIATVCALFDVNLSGSTEGGYITYVNGIQVSSGFMQGGKSIVLFLVFFGISFFVSRFVGWFIAGLVVKREGKTEKFTQKTSTNVIKLIISSLGIPFSFGFIKASSFETGTSVIILNMMGIVFIALCVLGIFSFIKWCKNR